MLRHGIGRIAARRHAQQARLAPFQVADVCLAGAVAGRKLGVVGLEDDPAAVRGDRLPEDVAGGRIAGSGLADELRLPFFMSRT